MNGLKDLYLPRSAVYQGDHRGIMRNPDCEFEAGSHYHDFYEVQFYFTSAGKIVLNNRAVLYEILACLYNDLYADSMNNPSAIDTISIVSSLISYIDEHLKEDLSLEELAREAHFSTAYLCRVFKKHTGTTLKQYINQKRIGLAKQLLLENVLPHTACQETGFNNYSYFYKTFKSITGLSPSEFYEMYHN